MDESKSLVPVLTSNRPGPLSTAPAERLPKALHSQLWTTDSRMEAVRAPINQLANHIDVIRGLTWYDTCVHTRRRQSMARRTIHIPEGTEALVRELALEGESFSATVTRLIDAGAKTLKRGRVPSYVASGDGPDDLGRKAETYLRELVSSA
jgi:hypothetical protein